MKITYPISKQQYPILLHTTRDPLSAFQPLTYFVEKRVLRTIDKASRHAEKFILAPGPSDDCLGRQGP